MRRYSSLISLLILVIFLSACTFSLSGDITPPPGSQMPAAQQATQTASSASVYPIVPPDLANGAKIYNQQCAQCHGSHGLGDGPHAAQLSVPVATLGLSDFARQFSPAEWYKVVTQGNLEKFMPAFASLTDRQRWDVVAYALSLSAPDSLVSQGKLLYDTNCANCHGQSGTGNGPDITTLSKPPQDFTSQAFMSQTSSNTLYQAISSGITPDMPAFSNTLNENERWALVDYIRTLTFATTASENTYLAPTTQISKAVTSNSNTSSQSYPNPVDTLTPQLSTTSGVTPTITFLGSATVQLINGSGGAIPSNVPVTLYGFDNMQNTYSETLGMGINGVYTFTNILMPKGRVFMAGADYDSATYGSDVVTADPSKPNMNLQVTVYKSTADISILTTDRVHIFFDFSDPKNVQVIEVFVISNPSKQAVISPNKDGTVVTFPLPQGYKNLQFQDGALGDRYVEVAQGFADKMTVNPGVDNYQVIFAFQLPYNRKLDFAQQLFLPASAAVVMVPDNGVKVINSQLQDGGLRDFQGTSYHMYNGSSLVAGSSIKFTLSGTPKKTSTSLFTTGTMQNLAIGLGVFGISLVIGGVWLYRRNQSKLALQPAPAGMDIAAPISDLSTSSEDEDVLMDAIIALDDQYHAGNLPKEAYLERRATLKDKLRKLKQG